jgi:hypothetical protein
VQRLNSAIYQFVDLAHRYESIGYRLCEAPGADPRVLERLQGQLESVRCIEGTAIVSRDSIRKRRALFLVEGDAV